MKRSLKVFLTGGLAIASCLVAAGCESVTEPKLYLSPDFGNAVRHNMAVQTVNPEASAGITEPPMLDGNRANMAITEYQGGKTKAVEKIKTSSVGQ